MTRISPFLSESYSEDLYSISEADFDEVMSTPAVIGDEWQGYGEWSEQIDPNKKLPLQLSTWTRAMARSGRYGSRNHSAE